MTAPSLLPTDAAFADLDPSQQKQLLIGLLGNFLDHAAAAGRQLDAWEQAAFRYGVTCLRHNQLSAALSELKRLQTPAQDRPAGTVPQDKSPTDIAGLRAELDGLTTA